MNRLIWHNNLTFNSNQIKKHIQFVKQNLHGLLPLYPLEYQHLQSYAKRTDIPITTLASIRNLIKIQEEIYRSQISPESKEKIQESFKQLTKNIHIESPSKHKYLIDRFFSSNKFSVKNILKIVGMVPEYKQLSHDTLKKLFQYMKDIEAAENDSKIRSMDFEKKLSDWLKDHIRTPFQTEEMIRLSISSQVSTPDILFDEPIEIQLDGKNYKILWIDAKNYALLNVPFIIKSLTKQSDKYNKEIGPGAFVFHYGIDSNIKIGSTLILDGSMIG